MRFKQFLSLLAVMVFVSSYAHGRNGQTMEQAALKRGNDLFTEARYEQAVKEYKRVTADAGDETYAIALYNIGVCYYELWQTDRAINFYRRAIDYRKGRYPRAWYALGIALEEKGESFEAEAAYKRALFASGGAYPMANYRLGLLASTKDFKTASEYFRKALEHAGEHLPASHNNLGVMLARMGRFNEAEKEFVIALRQTRGEFQDAAYNLKLCRSLMARGSNWSAVALRVSEPRKTMQEEN